MEGLLQVKSQTTTLVNDFVARHTGQSVDLEWKETKTWRVTGTSCTNKTNEKVPIFTQKKQDNASTFTFNDIQLVGSVEVLASVAQECWPQKPAVTSAESSSASIDGFDVRAAPALSTAGAMALPHPSRPSSPIWA
eukprot:SAG11_NODE_10998_length_790_cov_1.659913_1_plen_135_part_01